MMSTYVDSWAMIILFMQNKVAMHMKYLLP